MQNESWLPGSRFLASPNHDERPAGMLIDTVILHYISLPPEHFSGDAVAQLFTNSLDCRTHPFYEALTGLKVSSHFFLRRHGELIQFVPVQRRAWHAGVSRLLDRERCNDFSIGIELEGSSARPFSESQYRRLLALLRRLFTHLPIRYIAGHSDIAPGRKWDPGPYFDWQRLQPLMSEFGVQRPFPDETSSFRYPPAAAL
ncbi:MAG: 1,6-anhydro-N-acetylmuramyl-L-alanine amidase AmpD [Lautropia sp.]|nr:1,6-anhydro-N-acetylmuramyl-L-alanine amidase AmpD [Lautropia sp.]